MTELNLYVLKEIISQAYYLFNEQKEKLIADIEKAIDAQIIEEFATWKDKEVTK